MFAKLRTIYTRFWAEQPWIEGAGIITGFLGGLYLVFNGIPAKYQIHIPDSTLPLVYLAIAVAYLLVVSVLFDASLHAERRLRRHEAAFRYDKRGTLYNGHQPNISFRVATFKRILDGMASKVGRDVLRQALVDVGRTAAADFAANLPRIYDEDVAREINGRPWSELSMEEKVFQWTDYDSATGWGILTARIRSDGTDVTVTHLRGLFEGDGGLEFGYFLAGYCETVLTSILKSHQSNAASGKYRDYSRTELKSTEPRNEDSVELSYNWV